MQQQHFEGLKISDPVKANEMQEEKDRIKAKVDFAQSQKEETRKSNRKKKRQRMSDYEKSITQMRRDLKK